VSHLEEAGTHKSAKTHAGENPATSRCWEVMQRKAGVTLALLVLWCGALQQGKPSNGLHAQQQWQY